MKKVILPLIAAVMGVFSIHAQTIYTLPVDDRCALTSNQSLTCFQTLYNEGIYLTNFIGFKPSNSPQTAYSDHSVIYADEYTPVYQSFSPIIDSFTYDSTSQIYELIYHDPQGFTSVDLKFEYLLQSTHCGGKGTQTCKRWFWNVLAGSTYTIY